MVHEAEPLVWDQSLSSFANMTLEEVKKDKEDLASMPCSDVIEEVSLHLIFLLVLHLYILLMYMYC